MEKLVATLGKVTSLDKTVTGVGGQVSELVRRQQIGGQIGGSIYGLVWGELSNMLDTVLGTHVSNTTPTFNERMYGYMFRLLAINKFEKDLTLAMIASGAYDNGNPDGLPFSANLPLYSNIVSDYPAFVRGAAANEFNGIDSTESTDKETLEVTSLYPDDLGIGDFGNKWHTDNRNSILSKTKKLFEKGKINSLISRFGTKTDGEPDVDFNGKVGYKDLGMSRGRNLRRAGYAGVQYDTNGYNNPYCRVWTHHHQYDNYSKVIRPFVTEHSQTTTLNGTTTTEMVSDSRAQTMKKLHTWNNEFFAFKEGEDGEWGWKNENSEWSHSVLSQQNGVVNITPKFDEKGTIHTKDCMFSIENLAWKDYDPYTFENALSWEQRGPLGGRIMWFPPYGISFTENTNVTWNESTFIGRGENVYTYSNTTRSGTLSFMMLTDHPSVTDYASWWNDKERKVEDDVWNGFFAGCDTTPRDYIFEAKNDTVQQKIGVPQKDEPDNKKPSESVEEATFFVFFPNNYSGLTDGTGFSSGGDVDFTIGYLLGGLNAQKLPNSRNDDLISFKNSSKAKFESGRGYEMVENGSGVTDMSHSDNRIVGCKGNWHYETVTEYVEDTNKTWYYRIDGEYKIPTNQEEKLTNCYSQVLYEPSDYQDLASVGYNLKANLVPTDLCKNKENLFSFAEFAYAVSQYLPNCDGAGEYLKGKIADDRLDKVNTLIETMKNNVESVEVVGYANSQGISAANTLLAENRRKTMVNWLRSVFGGTFEENVSNTVEEAPKHGPSKTEAKMYRCARCTIRFSSDKTKVNNKDSEEFENVNKQTIENVAKETGTSMGDIKQELKKNGLISDYDEMSLSAEDLKYMFDKLKAEENRITQGKTSGLNKTRYDNEMFFYKKFQLENPLKWKALSDKLQYFDPAFHSMTPEGFNMRLTFLEQCTRQGDTISASDINNGTRVASNMAFGRPPFCVLRLGDFYNQLIVIKSITKNYDDNGALTWDLNDEGIGAQPMICHVTISFDFIGGGDLAGPVRRLQNAMSFNYYANASLYDNRADRMYYDAEENLSTKMGGAGNDQPSLPKIGKNGRILDKKGTYSVFHSVAKNKTDLQAKVNNNMSNTFNVLPETGEKSNL